jgi:hypothetical protein
MGLALLWGRGSRVVLIGVATVLGLGMASHAGASVGDVSSVSEATATHEPGPWADLRRAWQPRHNRRSSYGQKSSL